VIRRHLPVILAIGALAGLAAFFAEGPIWPM
jgi:hypothetical protein